MYEVDSFVTKNTTYLNLSFLAFICSVNVFNLTHGS